MALRSKGSLQLVFVYVSGLPRMSVPTTGLCEPLRRALHIDSAGLSGYLCVAQHFMNLHSITTMRCRYPEAAHF